jgi:hypothetical protein
MLCERSPLATAPITRAASLVGCTRLATSEFTFATESAHAPETGPTDARSVIFPCWPIARRSRSSSEARRWFSSTTSLKVSATFPATPVQ